MFDLAARQKLNRGYSDGLSRALEIVVTPLVFGLLGRLVDGWLDTRPWFTIGFAAFAVSGLFLKMWLGYDRQMKVEESKVAGLARPETDASP
jgi:F0F1-type ATP synthase assembly protein I